MSRAYIVHDDSMSLEEVKQVYSSKAQAHQHLEGGIHAIDKIPRLPVSPMPWSTELISLSLATSESGGG